MTTTEPTTAQPATVTDLPVAPERRVFGPIARAAAVALPLGAVLAAVSTVFDPPSTEPEPRGMYVAYGADPAGADVAATILHYGFGLIGVGLLLAGFAVAGGRGRILAWVGGALGALGFLNLSGAVVTDWYIARMAADLGVERAMELDAQVQMMPALTAGWMLPMVAGFALGPILLAVGLARAGVLRWWTVAIPVAVTVLMVAAKGLGPAGFMTALVLFGAYGVILALAVRRLPATR